jgi:DNA ligase (NAD+)
MERLAAAPAEEIAEIEGIGPIVAGAIHTYFREPRNRQVVEKLRLAGVNMYLREDTAPASAGPLAGQEFVLTGTLTSYSRARAEELVHSLGGTASDSVTRRTTYLVVGDKPGSKLRRAQQLGVRVIREEAFLQLIQAKDEW